MQIIHPAFSLQDSWTLSRHHFQVGKIPLWVLIVLTDCLTYWPFQVHESGRTEVPQQPRNAVRAVWRPGQFHGHGRLQWRREYLVLPFSLHLSLPSRIYFVFYSALSVSFCRTFIISWEFAYERDELFVSRNKKICSLSSQLSFTLGMSSLSSTSLMLPWLPTPTGLSKWRQ